MNESNRLDRSMDSSALSNAESWLSVIAVAKLVAAFLVVAGVAVEFGGDWVARPFEKIVREAREAELATLNQKTVRLSSEAEMARASIADASRNAAVANEKAAYANVRAANLEKEAAASNERAAEIMKATSWRQLTSEQMSKLSAVLSTQSGKYVAAWIANDPESLGLAIQFTNLIANFGSQWDMIASAKVYPNNLIFHIVIPDVPSASSTVKLFREAFTEAGISFVTDPLPAETMSFGSSGPIDGRAIILFGSKRPTFTLAPN
jgi:hypothetical protein